MTPLLSLCLVSVVLMVSTVEASPITNNHGLIYLGSFHQPKNQSTRSLAKDFDEFDYFMSVNPTTWAAADQDCKNLLGDEAYLVSLETEAEHNFLVGLLEQTDGTASTYYTGGKYQEATWKWQSGVPFGPWAKWGNGFPARPTSSTKVTLVKPASGVWEWRTQYATTASRYICEFPKTTIAVPCYEDNDLIILVDSSGSIGQENYLVALSFAQKLASAWKEHSGNRLGFKIFSSWTYSIFTLIQTPSQLEEVILNSPYVAGGTETHIAINEAVSEHVAYNRGVKRNIVVLTDGASMSPSETVVAANNAKASGIRTFSVGITEYVNQQELLTIAGGNSNHVFTTDTFEELILLLTPLSVRVCRD